MIMRSDSSRLFKHQWSAAARPSVSVPGRRAEEINKTNSVQTQRTQQWTGGTYPVTSLVDGRVEGVTEDSGWERWEVDCAQRDRSMWHNHKQNRGGGRKEKKRARQRWDKKQEEKTEIRNEKVNEWIKLTLKWAWLNDGGLDSGVNVLMVSDWKSNPVEEANQKWEASSGHTRTESEHFNFPLGSNNHN